MYEPDIKIGLQKIEEIKNKTYSNRWSMVARITMPNCIQNALNYNEQKIETMKGW